MFASYLRILDQPLRLSTKEWLAEKATQRTEKDFNIAVRPINTHDQGGIQSYMIKQEHKSTLFPKSVVGFLYY